MAYLVYSFGVGGLERCVARLVNELDRERFAPLVIALTRLGGAAEWVRRDDVPLLAIGQTRGNDPRSVWRLARLLRQERVDILHSHNWATLVEATLARRLAGVPVHVHAERGTVLGELDHRGWKMRLRGRVMRCGLERSDAVVAVAEAVREKIERASGYGRERVMVIENGVEVPPVDDPGAARARIRAELGLGPGAVLLGSVGRLVDVKDFPAAVAALAAVVAAGTDLHLVLVGDGPERGPIEAAARAAGVRDRLHLAGHQQRVGEWLAALDLYVNCSKSEGQSQSVLEALAAGLPCVVTDVGDNARLVGGSGEAGLVVPSGEGLALADAIGRLAGDPERRKELSHRALARHVQNYSVPKMLARYEQLYTQLAGDHPHGSPGKSGSSVTSAPVGPGLAREGAPHR